MLRGVVFLALSMLVAAGTTACVEQPDIEAESPGPIEQTAEDPSTVRDVVVSYDGPGEGPEQPDVVVAPPAWAPPDPMFFRIGAGYGALGQIDFGACRDEGLGPGYLHVRATFHHTSGRVVRASVERPAPPPVEALQCIGEQLRLAMVPVFDGADVTLSKSYFVN
jgi:hypothetical protein